MATTVPRNGIDRFKWQQPFTKGKFASASWSVGELTGYPLGDCSDSSSGTFECHLCRLKQASWKISLVLSFSSQVSHTVVDPKIKSSTYSSLRILATSSGSLSSQLLKCISITPPRKKGDGASPNRALVNLRVSNGDCSSWC